MHGTWVRSLSVNSMPWASTRSTIFTSLEWEEAFARWAERYPKRLNLNAAAALIGAIDNTDWRRVPSEEKERARKLIAQLKRA
jgi:hypothetical protein